MKIFNPSLVSASSLTRALCLLLCLSMLMLVACGEDSPPPNNAPTVVTAQSYVQCERREGDFALTEITFVIEDLEGSDTLSDPYVEFGSLSLPMTADPIAAPTEEELAAAEESEESEDSVTICPVESCQMRYTWIYQPGDSESALIGCPEDAPQIFVRIVDRNTNSKEFFLQPRRDE